MLSGVTFVVFAVICVALLAQQRSLIGPRRAFALWLAGACGAHAVLLAMRWCLTLGNGGDVPGTTLATVVGVLNGAMLAADGVAVVALVLMVGDHFRGPEPSRTVDVWQSPAE